HYKYKDIATNYLIILFQILYWINPLICLAFGEMRLDREIACDKAVLNMLGQTQHTAYGNTIIMFANKHYLSRQFAGVNQFASSKSQIKKRIECICAFNFGTKADKLESIPIFILSAGGVAGQVTIVSVMSGSNHRMDFNNKQAKYED